MPINCLFLAIFLLLCAPALGKQSLDDESSEASDIQSNSNEQLRTQAPEPVAEQDPSYQAKGFSLMLSRELNVRIFADSDFATGKAELDQRNAASIGLGYNAIRVRNVGGSLGLVYNGYELRGNTGNVDIDVFRAFANLTYGFNGGFYFYGGGNISYIYNEFLNDAFTASPTAGLQGGIGYQLTPNFAFTFGGLIQQTGYSRIEAGENSFNIEETDFTMRTQSINTGVTATF